MSNDEEVEKKRVVSSGRVACSDGYRESLHVHPEQGQLKWPSTGSVSVRTPGGIFVAPSSHAVWIPAGREHGGVYVGDVIEQNIYIRAERCSGLPRECCLVRIAPSLAKAVASVVAAGLEYTERSREDDLVFVDRLETELVDTGRRPLLLPLPEGTSVQPLLNAFLADPSDARAMPAWAAETRMATRSLSRAFVRATGMSPREWKMRVRLLRALQLLSLGEEVGQVARQLGYESPSAFVFRFREVLGTTPARYFDADARTTIGTPGFVDPMPAG